MSTPPESVDDIYLQVTPYSIEHKLIVLVEWFWGMTVFEDDAPHK